ncbi:hypothetical protein [Bacillus cereus group sp. BceL293]|uniref:hypothetical protein n=1 Tax=Bacillus cereus group sp. BceL293 TaxID=3444992 RepID=UPI003F237D8B
MGKIDTSYYFEEGRYDELAQTNDIKILHVHKIPKQNNVIEFQYKRIVDIENFFSFAKEKEISNVLCEIGYFHSSDFYINVDDMVQLMGTVIMDNLSFKAIEDASSEYENQFEGFKHKNGTIAYFKFMFSCEGIHYLLQIKEGWYETY